MLTEPGQVDDGGQDVEEQDAGELAGEADGVAQLAAAAVAAFSAASLKKKFRL